MAMGETSFEVKACEVRYFGPHATMDGRVTGVVRVQIEERFMGHVSSYHLDLKVKADVGQMAAGEVRTALLAHAARQLNKLRLRHSEKLPAAAE